MLILFQVIIYLLTISFIIYFVYLRYVISLLLFYKAIYLNHFRL